MHEWPVLGMPLATARSNIASALCSRCGWACTGGSGRAWQVVLGGLQFCRFVEIFQRRRQHSATTAHRALPVCEWAALGIPGGTAARSNAASGLYIRSGGACTGGCDRAVQVVYGDCGFAGLWRFQEEEAVLSNHSAQSLDNHRGGGSTRQP